MNRLWMLLFFFGCTAPTETQQIVNENYYLRFLKDVDTIYVDNSGIQRTETQVTKHIGAATNVRDGRMVLIKSNIYIRATAGFGSMDTIPVVNYISHTSKGYVGTAFGAFPNMVDMTAIVIARVIDDIHNVEEYKNIESRKVLAADTMRMIILPRK